MPKRSPRAYDAVKRSLDVVVAVILLVALSPVLAVVALRVHREFGGPVLFRQLRPGKDGQLFTIFKFRTMRAAEHAQDADAAVATDSERLTPFGRRLRSTSLDELPELWNVLVGDMSLVGPRPLLPEYLERYSAEQARRHEVRPGITGWAQVNGRNAASWKERLAMDVWYVDNRSFFLDVRILLMTVKSVLSSEGVSAPGQATVQPFTGTDSDEEKES